MKVLLSSQNELFVEIEDDAWVPTATSWILADHLELWLGRQSASHLECVDSKGRLAQWGVGLDGSVYPASGSPSEALKVERTERGEAGGAHAIRFKIQLPAAFASVEDDTWRITVAYSDSDNGTRQKRILATSQLKFGSLATLGRIRDILPTMGTCRREGAELHPVSTRVFAEGKPILE